MTLEDLKAATLDFLNMMAARDVEGLRARLTDGARWWPPESSAGRIPIPLTGARAVAELAGGRTLGTFQPGSTKWDVQHITAEEDRVAILMRRRAVSARSAAYDVLYHWLFRFEDGLIAEVWEVLDTSAAANQLGA